ncbi:penicillin-binding protein [marine bacterium AO1-C]|nr:penicillin-binding protein [marine bacterium AO1-C]
MKISVYLLLIFLSSAFRLQVQAQSVQQDKQLRTRIDQFLNQSAKKGFAGAVLVAKQGKVILSKGYGWADRKNKIPVTARTIFNVGSISKQFTAAAILKLVEQGKLKLKDKITRFFENVPEDKKDITVHQLLVQTSGISPRTGGFRYDKASLSDFLKIFYKAKLLTKPGQKHHYANANYILLAAIVEIVSQQNFDDFLSIHLWNPAQLKNTGYKRIASNQNQLAHGYYYHINQQKWIDWGTTPQHWPASPQHWFSIGKGDIHSTVEDLYKWHLALQNHVVLNKQSHVLFEKPYVPEFEDKTSYYAYGWAIFTSKRNTKLVTHSGSNGIYFADFLRFVDDDVVVIFMTNVAKRGQVDDAAWKIAKMVFDSNYKPAPLPFSAYELVTQFMNRHHPRDIQKLPVFLKQNLGVKRFSRRLLNTTGLNLLKKDKNSTWAIALLKLNVQIFPKDGNLWDSLGEAYLTQNKHKQAITSFEKALQLAPKQGCHWCENSKKQLVKLR